MQLSGRSPKESNSLFDDDFASGFEESGLDKFKPVLKVITALIIIAGLVTGGVWAYSKNTNQDSEISTYITSQRP